MHLLLLLINSRIFITFTNFLLKKFVNVIKICELINIDITFTNFLSDFDIYHAFNYRKKQGE